MLLTICPLMYVSQAKSFDWALPYHKTVISNVLNIVITIINYG